MANLLEIIPLGGIGEFGMNCTLLRFGDEMLVLDAGMGFPEESVYGVDVCIPDFEILEEFRPDITAASTQPALNPHAVQSPATVRLSYISSSGEIRYALLPGKERV